MTTLNEQIECKAKELFAIAYPNTWQWNQVPKEEHGIWFNMSKYALRCELEARLEEQDHDSTLSWDIERINELRVQIERLKEA